MRIEAIKVGKRVRKDLGDIDALVKSIETVGLLQPLAIDNDCNLVAGFRRLEACKRLKKAFVDCYIVRSVDDLLSHMTAERDENTCRKQFTPSEAIEMSIAIADLESKAAKERQGTRTDLHCGKLPQCDKGKTRDKVAKAIGMSGKTYEAAKKVVDAANNDPELKPVVAEMDRTGNVNKALKAVNKAAHRREVKTATWPAGKFRVIYADPPWQYNDHRDGKQGGGAEGHYDTMSLETLTSLDVKGLSTKDSVLWLWATSPLIPDALSLMKSWGFTYKASFVWDKILGYNGNYNDVRHELLLIGVRGKCAPEIDERADSVVSAKRTKHSSKPELFRKLIDKLYPSGPRVELFARTKAKGWSVWGNEV